MLATDIIITLTILFSSGVIRVGTVVRPEEVAVKYEVFDNFAIRSY